VRFFQRAGDGRRGGLARSPAQVKSFGTPGSIVRVGETRRRASPPREPARSPPAGTRSWRSSRAARLVSPVCFGPSSRTTTAPTCLSTLHLAAWLEERRRELQALTGQPVPLPALRDEERDREQEPAVDTAAIRVEPVGRPQAAPSPCYAGPPYPDWGRPNTKLDPLSILVAWRRREAHAGFEAAERMTIVQPCAGGHEDGD